MPLYANKPITRDAYVETAPGGGTAPVATAGVEEKTAPVATAGYELVSTAQEGDSVELNQEEGIVSTAQEGDSVELNQEEGIVTRDIKQESTGAWTVPHGGALIDTRNATCLLIAQEGVSIDERECNVVGL